MLFCDQYKMEYFFPYYNKLMEKIPLESNFKDIEPDLPSHRLGDLVTQNIGMGYDAHNAIADVSALQALFVKLSGEGGPIELARKHGIKPLNLWNSNKWTLSKNINIKSLCPLITKGIMKAPTTQNIAGSGLNILHLKVIPEREGADGLYHVFSVPNSDNKPRVTDQKKTLQGVIPKLVAYFESLNSTQPDAS